MKMKTKAIKKTSIKNNLLEIMYFVHFADELDVRLFLRTNRSPNNASNAFNSLVKDGYLSVTKVDDMNIVSITTKARRFLADYSEDEFYKNDFDTYKPDRILSSSNLKKIKQALAKSKIALMMSAVGVPVTPRQKPSLGDFYTVTNKELEEIGERKNDNCEAAYDDDLVDPDYTVEEDDEYYTVGDEDCAVEQDEYLQAPTLEYTQELLNSTGVYYSASEIRKFMSDTDILEKERFAGTRMLGVFVRSNKVVMIYANYMNLGQRMKIYEKFERDAVDAVWFLANTLTLQEIAKEYPFKIGDSKSDSYHSGVCAIVITNKSTSLVASMATGLKDGRNKSAEYAKLAQENGLTVKGKITSELALTATRPGRQMRLLQFDANFFTRIYVITSTQEGMESLKYIVKKSFDEYRKHSMHLFGMFDDAEQSLEDTKVLNPMVLDHEATEYIGILMPFYEIKTLHMMRVNLANAIARYDVICRKEMVNTISQIMVYAPNYYDFEIAEEMLDMIIERQNKSTTQERKKELEEKFYEIQDYLEIEDVIYVNENGYSKKQAAYRKKRFEGKVEKENELNKAKDKQKALQSRYNRLTHIRREIRTEEEIAELSKLTKELESMNEKKRKARYKKTLISLSVSEDVNKSIEAEAKKRGISKTKMAKMIVEEWSKHQNDDLS